MLDAFEYARVCRIRVYNIIHIVNLIVCAKQALVTFLSNRNRIAFRVILCINNELLKSLRGARACVSHDHVTLVTCETDGVCARAA